MSIPLPSIIHNYSIGELLGTGGFSNVHSGIHIPTNCPVAIKKISKSHFPREKFERELHLMEKLDHPFAISLFEYFEDPKNYYLIMEQVFGSNLFKIINSRGALPEKQIHHYFSQLIYVIEYLHNELSIAHRDLKPENIMIDRNDNIRLLDFGLSNCYATKTVLETACGSPSYAPPEMFCKKTYDHTADIWSAGVVLYSMAYGRLPFSSDNTRILVSKIVEEEPNYPQTISSALIDLMTRMICKTPSKRITIDEIKSHPWFNLYKKIQLDDSFRVYQGNDFIPDTTCINILKDVVPDLDACFESMKAHIFDEKAAPYRIVRRYEITKALAELCDLEVPHSFLASPLRMNSLTNPKNKKSRRPSQYGPSSVPAHFPLASLSRNAPGIQSMTPKRPYLNVQPLIFRNSKRMILKPNLIQNPEII